MESVPADYIRQRLRTDGLESLIGVLQKDEGHTVIAGSYTLQIGEPNDIDIWIPFHPERYRSLCSLLHALLTAGYAKISSRKQKNTGRDPILENWSSAYKRMDYMIDTIYTVCADKRRNIQILLLQEAGGNTAMDVIAHFDLNLNQQYYDGQSLYQTHWAKSTNDERVIRINTDSDVIIKQTFPEWVRTATRIQKYMQRGFHFSHVEISRLCKYIPQTLPHYLSWIRSGKGYRLYGGSYIDQWNRMAASTGLPHITYTVEPPGRYLSDISLFLCSDPIQPKHPESRNHSTYYAKHFTELTDEEQKTMSKPFGTESATSQSIFLAYDSYIHISSIVPYPTLSAGYHTVAQNKGAGRT